MFVVHLDGQLSAAIKASGRKIDRSNDGASVIGEEHLGVQFEMLQFVNLDADILHDAHPSDRFNQLFLFELMPRAGHDVNFHPTARCTDQSLNNHGILVALVLQKDGILRIVNKLRNALSAIAAAPDEMGMLVPFEGLS